MSQQINLFNPIFLQQKKLFAASTMVQALGVLVLGALLIAGLAWRSVADLRQEAADVTLQSAKKQARLASAAAEFAPRKASAAVAGQAVDAETQLAALRHVAQIVHSGDLGNTHGYAGYFRALGRQHQDGLWLTAIAIAGNAGMSLQGRTLNATLVPAWIERLTREPVLQGKSFGNLQITQPAEKTGPAVAVPYLEFALQANGAEGKP